MNAEDIRLTKVELTKLMRDYDFVKWKNDLDHRAAEAKARERAGKIPHVPVLAKNEGLK